MEKTKKTILVVDDTETNIDIMLELLSDKYDVVVALDGKSAFDAVGDNEVDLILLDIMMPDIDGYDVCRGLKADERSINIPIIFITALDDEKSIEKAYAAGGDDYVAKPFKPLELLARIDTQLKLKELINHLNYISSYDEMTGIYNRRKFFELGEKRFAQSTNELYAVMIDIDKFKNINDSYGHPTGDRVIKIVAKTVSEYLSHDAIFGRLGGEEFAILCNCPSPKSVSENIESIRAAVEALELLSDAGESIKLTISEGVAKRNSATKSLDDLLRVADVALYEAKGLGRNRVIFR
ncbi:diguanylate cyclase [Sulfurimonas crateris]|uniref:diguanylate cyclase n=1 Tax=Sulfurimonas crateris TaxID=2574727 RepID=A0A4U2Z9S4_9BACT|nr:diguanylate cyclase [Sulfurimonas crateris]TKI70362.1 diguanylate cyclase [Sulfurimonas crateris]